MKHSRGYILLTVLLLLMLAAVLMASFCRLAMQKSLEASFASDELQRRWGTLSCRTTILPNAENILELNESSTSPAAELHADFSLGTEKFAIDLCDEQAKVNVNAIYAAQGKDRGEQSIQNLVKAGGGNAKPKLRLVTAAGLPVKSAIATVLKGPGDSAEPTGADSVIPVFGSWSEIFPGVQRAELWPKQPGSVTINLTCWGNGSLNLRRASAASVAQMCSPALSSGQIGQLLAARSQLGENATVDDLFASAHIATTESIALSGRVTLNSATQSLWVQTHDHSGSQSSLFVRDGSNSGDIRAFSFQW